MNIVSYYTKDTPYEKVASKYLIPSLEKWKKHIFNFHSEVKCVDNQGSWYKNTAYKAKFIRKCLLKEPEDSLIWVDCDATIEKYPSIFEELDSSDYDIAFHTLDWRSWYGYGNSIERELLTGTMWFNNNEKILALCQEWFDVASRTNQWEQKVLASIIGKYDLKIYHLPIEYCYINSLPGNKKPLVSDKGVVIRHYQASREFKKKV
jgi:hypothetical protein